MFLVLLIDTNSSLCISLAKHTSEQDLHSVLPKVNDHKRRQTSPLRTLAYILYEISRQITYAKVFFPYRPYVKLCSDSSSVTKVFKATSDSMTEYVSVNQHQKALFTKVEPSKVHPSWKHRLMLCWDGDLLNQD